MKNDSFVGKMHHLMRSSANFQMTEAMKTEESLVDQHLFKKIADSPEKLRLRLGTEPPQTNEYFFTLIEVKAVKIPLQNG